MTSKRASMNPFEEDGVDLKSANDERKTTAVVTTIDSNTEDLVVSRVSLPVKNFLYSFTIILFTLLIIPFIL